MQALLDILPALTAANSAPAPTLDTAANSAPNSDESFLSVLLAQSEDSAKNITLQSLSNSQLSVKAANSLDFKVNLDEVKNSLLENTDFMQLLSILENLKGGKIDKFPALPNSLEKMLQTEQNINELKSAKNLTDLIKIAQKLNLNLENIEISSQEINTLKNEFKTLNSMKFFDLDETNLDEVTKQKVNDLIKENTPKNEVNLSKILQNLNEPNSPKNTPAPQVNSDKTNVEIKASNLAKPLDLEMNSDQSAEQESEISANSNQKKPEKTPQNNEPAQVKVAQEPVKSLNSEPKKPEKIVTNEAKVEPNSEQNLQKIAQNEQKAEVKQGALKPAQAQPEQAKQAIKDEPVSQKQNSRKTRAKPQIDESVDDYLASIVKRAKTAPNSEQKSEQIARSLANSAEFSENSGEFKVEPGEIRNVSATNNFVKNAVASAKLHKNLDLRHTAQAFASDLAQKISEYKPPITRFAMTLNPAELGEINVVMQARANNLHINITSNNQTMQMFFQNQGEFKQNLVNMGFAEVEMSFNSNSQNGGDRRQKHHAKEIYESLDEGDEFATSRVKLEIVVPKYV